ncbi:MULTISPECIES: peptide chain release factor N(5)-glutamine methyltransferase [unclassified Imperialibacter]|uniref:peptide chain release factor N(5)-glutamine methyltransferase n=1 Tax=unclassified Imperialibacter TaxID=2629706 RepID=UPI0012585AAA|nr:MULTISPECIES: peptide chain release factor N(5)-glutamine methyltransferase [unclassified Imperialibacter]CAD5289666.1 Release factor glutamine methyltransferase [Imperialibacter sp. 89]CAD5289937.1 Release factor glutamine methyltransferase [Imperialibacter sp. 75]VVT34550.1 Release factor glutamine methyltransferase [Imperialibacter sp. EC-SDR9]
MPIPSITSADKLFTEVANQLIPLYEVNEAQSITDYLLEGALGITGKERLAKKPLEVSDFDLDVLEEAVKRLKNQEPVQHVVGYGWFYGRKFQVNKNVLIPRPETEELVHWIANSHKSGSDLNLLDIGSGSGCIPITISLEAPGLQCEGWDISEVALEIARENAIKLEANVLFKRANILEATIDDETFDVIVSNPPYVRDSEKPLMSKNVLAFDPSLALFVGDNDPLIFYKRIATLAKTGLKQEGWLYFEINEAFGPEMKDLLDSLGYSQIELRQDINGKDRMVRGRVG